MMPGVDGWSVAEQLAADDETRDIPVVFLSARAAHEDRVRAQELGAVGYVVKPFDPLELAGHRARRAGACRERRARATQSRALGAGLIAEAAPRGHAQALAGGRARQSATAARWPLPSARRRSSRCSPSRASAPSSRGCSTSSRSSWRPPSAVGSPVSSPSPHRPIRSSTTSPSATTATSSTPRERPPSPCSSWRRCSAARCWDVSGRRASGRSGPCERRGAALDAATRLQNVADALATAHTPQEVLDAVLTEGVRAAEARGGLIATLSDDGEWLEVIASRGYDTEVDRPVSPVPGERELSRSRRRCGPARASSSARRRSGTSAIPSSSAARSRGTGSCASRSSASAAADRRPRLLVPDRPGLPARAAGAQDRARTAGGARPRTRPVLGGRAGAARAALLPRRSDRAAHRRRSSSSGRSSVSPSSRCRSSPTGARSRCSWRRRGRSSRSSSPTRIPSASAGPRRCSRTLAHDHDRRRVRPDGAGDPDGRAGLPPRDSAGAARRGGGARPERRRGARGDLHSERDHAAAALGRADVRRAHARRGGAGSCRTPTSSSRRSSRRARRSRSRTRGSTARPSAGPRPRSRFPTSATASSCSTRDGRVRFWNSAAAAITGVRGGGRAGAASGRGLARLGGADAARGARRRGDARAGAPGDRADRDRLPATAGSR